MDGTLLLALSVAIIALLVLMLIPACVFYFVMKDEIRKSGKRAWLKLARGLLVLLGCLLFLAFIVWGPEAAFSCFILCSPFLLVIGILARILYYVYFSPRKERRGR